MVCEQAAARCQTDPVAQSASVVVVHTAVAVWQHAPGGCAQGLGEQVPPVVQLLPVGHAACAVRVHAPAETLQHSPCGGCGQGLGVQVAAIIQALPASHPGWVVVVHAPVEALQQVRVQVLPCGQFVSVVVVQPSPPPPPPPPLQHWPWGAGHGLGEQTPPSVNMPEVHATWKTTSHWPVAAAQQDPLDPTSTVTPVTVI